MQELQAPLRSVVKTRTTVPLACGDPQSAITPDTPGFFVQELRDAATCEERVNYANCLGTTGSVANPSDSSLSKGLACGSVGREGMEGMEGVGRGCGSIGSPKVAGSFPRFAGRKDLRFEVEVSFSGQVRILTCCGRSGFDIRPCQGIVGMRGRGPGNWERRAESRALPPSRSRSRLSSKRGGGERLGHGGDGSGRRLFRSSARRSS